MNFYQSDIVHQGDVLAIPFFILLVVYLWRIKKKSLVEYALLAFALVGLIFDFLSTYSYFNPVNIVKLKGCVYKIQNKF